MHPDNFHLAIAVLAFFLSYRAIKHQQPIYAILAIALGGVAVWAKQTAVSTGCAAAAGFAIAQGCTWKRALGYLALAAATTALAVLALWHSPDAKFYTLDLLRWEGVDWKKFPYFLLNTFLKFPYALAWASTPVAARMLLKSSNPRARQFLILWCVFGFFVACPTTLSYLKVMGNWNNLQIIRIWPVILTLPLLATARPGLRWESLVWVLLLIGLISPKRPPSDNYYGYGSQLTEMIGRDLASGRTVLLAHGTMPLIANGVRLPPLDRANSVVELNVGGLGELAQTRQRIASGYYDTLYINSWWYGPEIEKAIKRNFHVTGLIPKAYAGEQYVEGFQDDIAIDVNVWQRN
jgi:hypothetical protein